MSSINLFDQMISLSIKGSFIILCILLLKFIFKNHFGAKWHYLIWFVLIICLMMPYSPNSPLSIFNLVNLFDQTSVLEVKEHDMHINPIQISIVDGQLLEGTTATSENAKVQIVQVISWIWIIGVVSILFYTIWANLHFFKKWRNNAVEAEIDVYKLLEKCKLTIGVKKDIPIFYTDQIKAPVLLGLVYPQLLLPVGLKNALDNDELTCIMMHELSHYKRKDIATFWVMAFLKAVYWMNPLIWYALHKMRQDCEVACDALALSYMNENDNEKYGYTIIRMIQNNNPIGIASVAGMTGNKSQIERRLKMIAKFKKSSHKLTFISIAVLVVIGFVFLTSAQANKVEPQSTDSQPIPVKADNIQPIIEETHKVQGGQENQQIEDVEVESAKMIWPLPSKYNTITNPYGWRTNSVTKEEKLHEGIDIIAPKGVNIVAVQKGTVTHVDMSGDRGKTITIQHDNNIETVYAQCSEILVNIGDEVETGDVIALVGSTGKSTGPHLHFEVREAGEPVDPIGKYLNATVE